MYCLKFLKKQLPFSFYNLTSCRNSMYFCIKQWWKLWPVEIQRLPLRTWELQCVNSPQLRSLHKEPDLHKSLRYYKCTLVVSNIEHRYLSLMIGLTVLSYMYYKKYLTHSLKKGSLFIRLLNYGMNYQGMNYQGMKPSAV